MIGITDQTKDGTLCCSCTEQWRREFRQPPTTVALTVCVLSEGKERIINTKHILPSVERIFMLLPVTREYLCLLALRICSKSTLNYSKALSQTKATILQRFRKRELHFSIVKRPNYRFCRKGKGVTRSLLFLLRFHAPGN